MIGRVRLRDVDTAAGDMYRDLDSRLPMVFREDYLRVMGAAGQLRNLLDELLGVRAHIVIDLGVTGGDGDAHSAFPFAFGNGFLDMRQRSASGRVPGQSFGEPASPVPQPLH